MQPSSACLYRPARWRRFSNWRLRLGLVACWNFASWCPANGCFSIDPFGGSGLVALGRSQSRDSTTSHSAVKYLEEFGGPGEIRTHDLFHAMEQVSVGTLRFCSRSTLNDQFDPRQTEESVTAGEGLRKPSSRRYRDPRRNTHGSAGFASKSSSRKGHSGTEAVLQSSALRPLRRGLQGSESGPSPTSDHPQVRPAASACHVQCERDGLLHMPQANGIRVLHRQPGHSGRPPRGNVG